MSGRFKQISWTAGNDFSITDNLLLYFRINRIGCLAVLAGQNIFCLVCRHLVALAEKDIEHCLCTDDLR